MALAYEANTSLAFDTNVLRQCAKRYGRLASELNGMSRNLDRCISVLKESGWTTPAGSAFHEMTNTNWTENIKKYVDLLNTLEQILYRAAEQYESLLSDHVGNTRVRL